MTLHFQTTAPAQAHAVRPATHPGNPGIVPPWLTMIPIVPDPDTPRILERRPIPIVPDPDIPRILGAAQAEAGAATLA